MTTTKKNGEKYKLSPETRQRMAAAQRKRFGKKEVKADAPEIDEATFAYALGYTECWLATYAAAAGVSTGALAARVGKVLHGKARG